MKWNRAVHHLDVLAQTCAEMATRPASIYQLRVAQLWAVGDILGGERDMDVVTVALAVDRPAVDVPWLGRPSGAQHWDSATRLSKNPILAFWRSAHAPIWNHHIVRPALVWDATTGIADEALAAIRDSRAEPVRLPAPTAAEFTARLADELEVSLAALRSSTATYDDRRWRPGKMEPVADALWLASAGYLEVRDGVHNGRS